MTRGHGATGAHFEPDNPDDPDDPDDPDELGQPQFSLGFPHELQLLAVLLHPHIGFGRLHFLQGRASEKPSFDPPTRTRSPSEPPV